MCLGMPMQVEQLSDEHFAVCREGTQKHVIDISLVGKQPKGAWLLVFLGAAREVMTEQQAQDTLNALRAVQNVMQGEYSQIDHLFADLIEREPYLPEHLRDVVMATPTKEIKE